MVHFGVSPCVLCHPYSLFGCAAISLHGCLQIISPLCITYYCLLIPSPHLQSISRLPPSCCHQSTHIFRFNWLTFRPKSRFPSTVSSVYDSFMLYQSFFAVPWMKREGIALPKPGGKHQLQAYLKILFILACLRSFFRLWPSSSTKQKQIQAKQTIYSLHILHIFRNNSIH